MRHRLFPSLAIAIAIGACTSSSEDKWRRYHRDAEALLQNGRHTEAILQFRNALRANPKSTETRRGLATAYARTGQWTEALSNLDHLAGLDPTQPHLLERARYALAAENAGLARRHLYDFRVDRPGDFEAAIIAGWVARSEARLEAAHQNLESLLEKRKDAPAPSVAQQAPITLSLEVEASLVLSLLDERLERFMDARERLAPLEASEEPLVAIRRGELAASMGDWKKSITELKRARRLAEGQERQVELSLYLTGQWRTAEVWRLAGEDFASYLPAEVAYRDSHYEAAVELTRALLERPGVGEAARILTARSLRELERYDDAVAVLLPVDGGEESKLLLGLVLTDAGQPSKALPAFRDLSGKNPTEPDYAYFEGQAYSQLDRPEEARAAYERALLAPGGHDNAFQALVELDLLARKSAAAERRVTAALARAPESASLHVLKGTVAEAAQRYDDAALAYREAIGLDPNSAVARRRLGQLLVQRGQLEEARNQLDRSLLIDPADLGALMVAGMLSERLGEVRAAMRYYRDLLDQHPDFYPAANNLAYLYADQGTELGKALGLARMAVRAQPNHGGFLDTLGWIHHQRGDCAEAVSYLKRAATASPDRAMIWVHLGLAGERCGQEAEALRAFRAAAKRSPSGKVGALVKDGLGRLETVKSR